MATNEERKQVAARLRLLDYPPESRDMFLVLADLIEPEERTCRNESGYWHLFECSNCGCEVEGGDEYGHNSSHGSFNYCPNCGNKVINNAG